MKKVSTLEQCYLSGFLHNIYFHLGAGGRGTVVYNQIYVICNVTSLIYYMLQCYHLSNRTKFGPLFNADPDQIRTWICHIRTNTSKSDLYQTSLKMLEVFSFKKHLLLRWIPDEKDQFSALILPFFVKSGLFYANPDHFRTKVRKKRTKWEHCNSIFVAGFSRFLCIVLKVL